MTGAPRLPRRAGRWAVLAAALVAAARPRPAPAEEVAPAASPARSLDDLRRTAMDRGCAYLAENQQAGGHFGGNKAMVAITALSTLALMAHGSGVRRGPYGRHVESGVGFLLKLVEQPSGTGRHPDGYFDSSEDKTSKMHGQGYATLALASAIGSADTETATRLRAVLRRAVACAEASQTGTGGWGYDPDPAGEHEGSVTVTIAQGLRAARDAGLLVNAEVVRRGLLYLRKSQRLETKFEDEDGSFKYSLTTDRSSYALTAAAVSSFFLFGEYVDPKDPQERVRRGVRYIQRSLAPHLRRPEWFFYGNFYAAWAAWQMDGDSEDAGPDSFWPAWHRRVYPEVLARQRSDGSWNDKTDTFAFGDVLPTAFAVLTLAIPDEQLPIFQR